MAPDEFLVGSVTRLHDSKGNSYLVDAAQKVIAQRPRTRFVIFGEGPLRPELEAQARALGLGDRFVFDGFARDVARVVSAFDVSVFPSLWEGTPLTVFEALAMGKPIVATDADGLVDVLTHDRDAVIVPKRDADGAGGGARAADRQPRGSRAPVGAGARHGPAVRHRRVRAEDGAALRPAARGVAHDAAPGRAAGGPVVPRPHGARRVTLRPGLILAAVFLCVYGTLALVVNLPKATYGFKSDEATYYMMGHSLVHDGT